MNLHQNFKYFFTPVVGFTVNGIRCMSKPRLNTDVGYWYCETADRSDAGWDYCCSPDNQCGYSDGYEYPW